MWLFQEYRCECSDSWGDLISAAATYGIPSEQWLDLSTGINPAAYPVPVIPGTAFQQLPYPSAEFKAAVCEYYGGPGVACNGTQQAIELLPTLLPSQPVLLPAIGYQEHKRSWQAADATIDFYPAGDQVSACARIDQKLKAGSPFHLLLINPNNPSGLRFSAEQIYQWAEQMPQGSYLIIDEAFIDLSPEQSVLNDYDRFQQCGNLVVLRSFGKFFGLAGIRLGFVFSHPQLQQQLHDLIGSWAVNGPAQSVATAALKDQQWQQQARLQVAESATVTAAIWQPLFDAVGTDYLAESGLFISVKLPQKTAQKIYQSLAEQGILIRLVQGKNYSQQIRAVI